LVKSGEPGCKILFPVTSVIAVIIICTG
jgi:hypothetical protein